MSERDDIPSEVRRMATNDLLADYIVAIGLARRIHDLSIVCSHAAIEEISRLEEELEAIPVDALAAEIDRRIPPSEVPGVNSRGSAKAACPRISTPGIRVPEEAGLPNE